MGPRLRELRLRAGLSQRQLAAAVDVQVHTVANWERARRTFNIEMAVRLADALEVSLDELAGRQWPPPKKGKAP